EHLIFENIEKSTLSNPKQVDTLVWGVDNYYFGVTYEPNNDGLYLCTTNWGYSKSSLTDILRCGLFANDKMINDKWYNPKAVRHYADGKFIYPTLLAQGHRLSVATGHHPNGYVCSSSKCPTAARNAIYVFNYTHYGEKILNGFTLGRRIGSPEGGYYPHIQDISQPTHTENNVYYVLTQKADINNMDPVWLEKFKDYKHSWSRPVNKVKGNAHNLFISNEGNIHVVGNGIHAYSEDDGQTWTTNNIELSGVPQSEYDYNGAHTLKLQFMAGSLPPNTLYFLQEVVHRSSGKKSVYSVIVQIP
ncbi:MAG: hypothetical protein AABZ06_06870, partial [Bdellovibrionota bacterium]